MESLRTAVYLSVCLSVLSTLCQGQRSADNQLPSAPDGTVGGLSATELVRVCFSSDSDVNML